jgi:hypothetical protein
LLACGGHVEGEAAEQRPPRIPATATPVAEPPPPSDREPNGAAGGGAEGEAMARRACDQCHGDWGVQGFNPAPSCNCRTTDVGRVCLDGSECQGQCLSSPASQVVTSAGPPRLGYYIGECSEFEHSYGCHIALQNGVNTGAPLDLDEAPPTLCID